MWECFERAHVDKGRERERVCVCVCEYVRVCKRYGEISRQVVWDCFQIVHMKNERLSQGSFTEEEGSVRLTSLYQLA
jgi:hypothetical protein